MTSLSAKTPFEQIVNYYWSNRFSTENNTLIHHDFNQAIRARIDVNDFSYKKNQQALIHLLRNKDICAYQSALLACYFREPEKHLDLDVDYLSLNFDCNNNAAVEKLLSARGLVKARNKAEAKVLKVSCESGVGHVNVNTDKETGVIYTHRFSLALFGNLYKRIQLYISDGSKGNGSIEFRIDLIPSKFTDFELQIFFSHIKSNVGARPFEQLMNKATFSRVDIGFNLPGLSQLFLYPNHKKNKRVTSGESLPENCLAETTYLGDRIRSNFFILYDKILKEAKFHHRRHGSPLAEKKSFVEKLAVTSRVERRYRPRRDGNKKALPISSLPDVNISFKPLAFFNPKILPFLSDKELKRLLKDKSITGSYAGKPHYQPLTKTSRKEKKTSITLNSQWFDNAKKELAQSLLDTIRKPKSFSSSELESFNNEWLGEIEKNPLISNAPSPSIATGVYRSWDKAKHSLAKLTVIYGGAGTGKTSLLLERMKFLQEQQSSKQEWLVCLAFTNDAVEDLQLRAVEELDHSINHNVTISTFTKWCGDSLREHSSLFAKFQFIGDKDKDEDGSYRLDTIRKIIEDLGFSSLKEKVVEQAIVLANRDVKPLSQVAETLNIADHTDQLVKVINAYEFRKREMKLWDFDDVLILLEKHLKDAEFLSKLKSCCTHMLLDEMQDSNRLQIRIIKRLLESDISVTMVGDTSQAIYRFRGGRPELIDKLVRDCEYAKEYKVGRQHRASIHLLRLTNFARRHTGKFAHELRTTQPEAGCKPYLSIANTIDDAVINVRQYLKTLNTSDVLILVRTKAQKKSISDQLVDVDENTKVMTMHAAKGLECDACIVIDPRFAGQKMDERLDYCRLIYTALTRPRKHLLIIKSPSTSHYYVKGTDEDINILDTIISRADLYHEF